MATYATPFYERNHESLFHDKIMVNTLRRFSKPIMLIVTVLVIVSFSFWSPNVDFGGGGSSGVELYGKEVSRHQIERERRKLQIHYQLRGSYARLVGDPRLALVFDREADALGVTATDDQKKEILSQLPAFMDDGGHPSPQAYEKFIKDVMNPAGYAEDQLAGFLDDEVRIRRVREIVGATSGASPFRAQHYLQGMQMKTEASYILLKRADFLKDVKVTEEAVKKAYEDQKERHKTPAQRKVKYAVFPLVEPPDGKPMTPEARDRALQLLADKAWEFRAALEAKDANFDELAKKMGARVEKTPEFFDAANPPQVLEGSPAAGRAAFEISKEKPYSRHLALNEGMHKGTYVLAFEEEKAPEQLSFEAVKKKIEDELLASEAGVKMNEKGKELRAKIEEAKKAGKSFYEAAEAVGEKPVPFPVFGGMTQVPPQTPFNFDVRNAVQKLAPGQLSEPIAPNQSKGENLLIVHLDQRTAGEEKIPGMDLKDIMEGMDTDAKERAFSDWILARARAAGLNFATGPAE